VKITYGYGLQVGFHCGVTLASQWMRAELPRLVDIAGIHSILESSAIGLVAGTLLAQQGLR
jgi:hypothetical protein